MRLTGTTSVFADIDLETFNLDAVAGGEIVRKRDVDAILAVHLYGLPGDLDPVRDIADE